MADPSASGEMAAAVSDLALERHFPALAGVLPRVELTVLPTPVERLERLGAATGGAAELWIKRDDRSGTRYGGNKPRKLEFVFGDALVRGKRSVLTFGGIGSNHALATAVCARALGLRCILVLLWQPVTDHVRHCLLLYGAAGAELHYAPGVGPVAARAAMVCAREAARGQVPYVIPAGGTSVRGTLGYVNAALELREQIAAGAMPEPDWIFVPLGSGGTVAGLLAGLGLAGLRSRVAAVLVTDIRPPDARQLARLANAAAATLRARDPGVPAVTVSPADVCIVRGYLGDRYGAPTEAARRARDLMADREGIRLETTYTAKCLAALLDAVRLPTYRGTTILFWNTFSSVDPTPHLGPLPSPAALPPAFRRFFEGPVVPA